MCSRAKLSYATPSEPPEPHPWSLNAIVAMLFGVGCGPFMIVKLRSTDVVYGISSVGDDIALKVGIPVIIYCAFALLWVLNRDHLRGAVLAVVGLVASVLWTVGLIVLFEYIDATIT